MFRQSAIDFSSIVVSRSFYDLSFFLLEDQNQESISNQEHNMPVISRRHIEFTEVLSNDDGLKTPPNVANRPGQHSLV